MKTRKEIKDRYGERSLYVVERRYKKSKIWRKASFGHNYYKKAIEEKKFNETKYKGIFKFRIVLYGRLERDDSRTS